MPADRPVVAHVLHQLYLAGAEVLAAGLARKLSDRYRFVFLALDQDPHRKGGLGRQLAAEGFEVHDLGRRPGVDWAVSRRLRGVVRSLGPRVLLHAHQYTPFFYAALARFPLGAFRGTPPILLTEHGRHYPDSRRPKRVLANKLLLRPGDRVTAVGCHVRDLLVANEGLPANRIEVVLNGIDPGDVHPGGAEAVRAAVRAELNVPADAPIVLQVARFHPVKDHATALRAFAQVAGSGVTAAPGPSPRSGGAAAVLVLAGDGEQREAMQALARTLGLAERVRFLGVRQDVPRLMRAADVFLLSSLSEGISVTLLEAMAAGVPIAATAVGGNGEVVAEGQSGLLTPRQDPEALGRSLARLLADADLRQRMGQAGRARLLAHFTQDRMHARYAAIYDAMLAAPPG